MNPSAEQQKVLDEKNRNIIVSASAGSGKTTVMTEKLKEFIKDNNSVKDILVLTYTKAAATEMKKRLEEKMMEENTEYMQKQIDDLTVADISTFHSFCQKLIKKYFYVLGISPNFEILGDIEEKILLDKAYNDAVKKTAKKSEEDYVFALETFFSGRNDNTLKEMVFSLKNFFDSIIDSSFDEKSLDFFDSDFAVQYLNNEISINIDFFKKILEALQVKADSYGYSSYVAYVNNILSQISLISKVDLFRKIEIIESLEYGTLRTVKQDELKFSENIRLVKDRLKKYTDKIKEKKYGTEESLEKVRINSKRICKTLLLIYENLVKSYTERKNKINKLDYSNLERYTLKLLENEEVRNEIKNKYKLIAIDEFQDANQIQETIIKLIAKDNNRFMVGDVKQSIYAFRQSNPDIFLEIQEKYKDEGNSTALKLNDNYRSDAKILDFVNIIFSKIMTEETAGINYERDAKFVGKAEYKSNNIKQVNIDIIKAEDKENIKLSGIYSVKDNEILVDEESHAEKEAILVANRILELLNTKIYDAKSKEFRKVNFDDICILLRTRGNYQKIFASTLADAGIPLAVNSNSLLFETEEGRTCLNFLEIVSNSKNDICLAGTLTSLLFELNEEELVEIRLTDKKSSFYDAVKNYDKDDTIKQKIDNFYTTIDQFKTDMEFFGLYEAMNNLFNKCSLFEKCSLYPDGESKILNYKTFLNLFTEDISLDEFLSSSMSPNVVNLCAENSVVDITTIHSSKGLEYPIVFVCNLGADFYKDAKSHNLVISKNYGFATKVADTENKKAMSSIYFDVLKDINKRDEFAEKIRLLYVGLTRAKNHLYLVGTKTKLDFYEFENNLEILNTRTFLDLIINSLDKNIIEELLSSGKYENENISVNIHNEDFVCNQNVYEDYELSIVDNSKVKELYDFLTFNIEKNKIAFKNSVSSLNKEEYTNLSLIPKTLTIDEHLKLEERATRGTDVHKILELINFDDIKSVKDLSVFINSLLEIGEISTTNLDIEKLYENILTLKKVAKGQVLKEKTFVMKVPYSTVVNSSVDDKILIQGIVDLIILGEKNIIIDYKLTSIFDDEVLKSKYFEQLKLYRLAVENGLNLHIDEVYLFNLNKNKLIKM